MYTIKRASERTGVSLATLRAWERRYGIGAHARSESGYRLYDEKAIEAISAMRSLVEAGWAPRQASADILRRGPSNTPALGAPAQLDVQMGRKVDPDLTSAFILATKNLDERALAHALDEAFARGSFEFVLDNWLMPTLAVIGDEWVAGRIGIASEHFASNAIMRRIHATFEVGVMATFPSPVLVGLPSNSYHEIGTLALATALRRRGIAAAYLGADVPVEAWTTSLLRQDSAAAIIGVMTSADIGPAREIAEAVNAINSHVVVAVGGPYAHKVGGKAVVLPSGIDNAADVLVENLAL
jgi:DNA-binding transcriptional MerR regulator